MPRPTMRRLTEEIPKNNWGETGTLQCLQPPGGGKRGGREGGGILWLTIRRLTEEIPKKNCHEKKRYPVKEETEKKRQKLLRVCPWWGLNPQPPDGTAQQEHYGT